MSLKISGPKPRAVKASFSESTAPNAKGTSPTKGRPISHRSQSTANAGRLIFQKVTSERRVVPQAPNSEILAAVQNDPDNLRELVDADKRHKIDEYYVIQASGLNTEPNLDPGFDDPVKGTGSYPLPTSERAYRDLGIPDEHVIAVDIDGVGPLSGSSHPSPNAERVFQTAEQAVEQMIDDGNPDAKLLLVGHSMGGMDFERAIHLYGDEVMANDRTFRENVEGLLAEQTPFEGTAGATALLRTNEALGRSDTDGMRELRYGTRDRYYSDHEDLFGDPLPGDSSTALDGVNVGVIATDTNPEGYSHGDGLVYMDETVPRSGGDVWSYSYEE